MMRAERCRIAAALLCAGCGGTASITRPAGPPAEHITELWWLLLGICSAVYVIVAVLLLWALFHRERAAARAGHDSNRRTTRWILLGGMALPAMVLAALFVFSMMTFGALRAPRRADVVIEVTGHQWWWRAHYLEAGGRSFETANELHIPVGQVVEIRLGSADVIHSFWVPELAGKVDLIPGKSTSLWLRADRPGVYRGQCAEYCGLQHAHMALLVVAESPDRYAAWLGAQRLPARPPLLVAPPVQAPVAAPSGPRVFAERGCDDCHAIRGTSAGGAAGPDLTHVASRRMLAAGTRPNDLANLMVWIADPQAIKPGNKMPRVPLPPAELQAVAEYLASLH